MVDPYETFSQQESHQIQRVATVRMGTEALTVSLTENDPNMTLTYVYILSPSEGGQPDEKSAMFFEQFCGQINEGANQSPPLDGTLASRRETNLACSNLFEQVRNSPEGGIIIPISNEAGYIVEFTPDGDAVIMEAKIENYESLSIQRAALINPASFDIDPRVEGTTTTDDDVRQLCIDASEALRMGPKSAD